MVTNLKRPFQRVNYDSVSLQPNRRPIITYSQMWGKQTEFTFVLVAPLTVTFCKTEQFILNAG